MSEGQNIDVKLPPMEHMGVVVRNVDLAVEHYTRLGFGPFKVFQADVSGYIYRGKEVYARLRLAHSAGPVPRIDLIQTLEGNNPHIDFLREKGEGVDHIGYHVAPEDFDKKLAEFAEKGIVPVYHRLTGPMPVVYLDTADIGGIMIELMGIKKGQTIASMVDAKHRKQSLA